MENSNKPFFDPYVLNNTVNPTIQNMPKFEKLPDIDSGITSTTKYYEQQYMYYKYLTQVLEYQIKIYEYEKLTQNSNTNQNQSTMKQNSIPNR